MKKNIFLPAVMTGMLLIPAIPGMMNIGIIFLSFSIMMLLLGLAEGKKQLIFKGIKRRDIIVYIGILLVFIIEMTLKFWGITQESKNSTDAFLSVIAVLVLFIGLRMQKKWEQGYFNLILMSGGLVLIIYFVDTAIIHNAFWLWRQRTDIVWYINMLSLLIMLIAVGQYIYCDVKKWQIIYLMTAAISALVMAINAAWGTAVVALFMIFGYTMLIVPVASVIRKLLIMFFGISFLFCNMSLVVNYSGLIRVEGLTYSLQCSVVGELILSVFAVYVMKEWDKIPEGAELERVRLCRLQTGLFYILQLSGALIIANIALARVEDKIGIEKVFQSLAADKWEQASTDVFVVSIVSLARNMSRALTEAWSSNIFAVMYQMYSIIGVLIITVIWGLTCYRLYRILRENASSDLRLTWIAIGLVAGLVFLPVMVEALPVYAMIILLTIFSSDMGDSDGEIKEAESMEKVNEEDGAGKEQAEFAIEV